MVVSTVHAFTDQVTGLGGSIKRGIGSKVMASQMREIYEAERQKSQKGNFRVGPALAIGSPGVLWSR